MNQICLNQICLTTRPGQAPELEPPLVLNASPHIYFPRLVARWIAF